MSVAEFRRNDLLRDALGPDVARLLAEDGVTDLLLNAPDGKLWVDRLGTGRVDTGCRMSPADADAALRVLASHCGEPLTRKSPILSATLPGSGERIAAAVAPVVEHPVFAIRKPPMVVFGLDAFRGLIENSDGAICQPASMSDNFSRLMVAVEKRKNVLISGATGSGKTSLLSALLHLESVRRDRVIAIEDTHELALDGISDHCRFLTTPEVNMRELVKLALRFRVDRIIIGEMRSGNTALKWINSCNSGHTGSFATIHASSAHDAMGRMEDLCNQVCLQTPTRAIQHAIGCIVFVVRTPVGRCIKEVILI